MRNSKRMLSALTAFAMTASAFSGMCISASAAEGVNTITPIADTYIDTADATSHADATELRAMQTTKAALVKFDASQYLGKTITKAELTFNIASRAYNTGRNRWESSSIVLSTVDTAWEDSALPEAYTISGSGNISNAQIWSDNDSATPSDGIPPYSSKTFDVTEALKADEDGIIAFEIATGTGREQAIASMEDTENAPTLTITTTDAAQVSYSLKAAEGEKDLGVVVASGEATAGSTVTVSGIPKYVQSEGAYYVLDDENVSEYSKEVTLGEEAYEGTVSYSLDNSVLYASEGEKLENATGITNKDGASAGAYGAIAGGKKASIGIYSAGEYVLKAYVNERGDRGLFVRNAADADNTTNAIANLDITRDSAAGEYEVSFTLTDTTELELSGYTTDGGSVNQSTSIDYVVLTGTGKAVEATPTPDPNAEYTATITVTGNGAAKFVTEVTATDAPTDAPATDAPITEALAFVVDANTPVDADTVYTDDDNITVKTVFAGKIGGTTATIAGREFTNNIQIRVDAAPDSSTGYTEKADNTPLLITAKKSGQFTVYYRRQASSGSYAAGDGKDIKLSLKNADGTYAANIPGVMTMESYTEDQAYGYGTQVFDLTAGNEYILWAKGTTGTLFGYDFAPEATASLSDYTVEELTDTVTAKAGETITVKVTEGTVNSITTVPAAEVTPVEGKEGYYTFVMPAADTAVTADFTATATDAPTDAPATDAPTVAPIDNKVYINESFEGYPAGTIIKSAGNDVDEAYQPVTYGDITYAAGRRNNGSINSSQSFGDYEGSQVLVISEDGYATNGRGVSFSFSGVPATAQIPAGQILELSMDVTSTQSFELTGFGTVPAIGTAGVASLSEAVSKAVLTPVKSADTAVVIKAVYDNGRLVSMTAEDKTNVVAGTPIEVEAAEGTKVMLWNSLNGMEPIAEAATAAVVSEPTDAPTDTPATDAPTDAPTNIPTLDPDATEAPAPVTSLPHLRAIIDPANGAQYIIITDTEGNVLSSSVAPLTATGFTGATFYTANTSANIDNLKVEVKDSDVGIAEVNVKNGDNALEGADVAIGSIVKTTDSNGKVQFALPNGTYDVTASKSGYEHTEGMQDNAAGTVTVNSNKAAAELTLRTMSYIKVPDTVTIEGGQTFVAAPKEEDAASSEAFTVKVLDQYGIPMTEEEYGLTWSVFPAGTSEADANVTINQNGVVTVSKGFSTESKVAAYDVTVVAATDDRNQKVTKTLYVGNNDIIYYDPINWKQDGGTGNRNGSVNLAEPVTLPDISSVTINVNFPTGTEGQSTLVLASNGGNLTGIQYQSTGIIKAWTGWNGNTAFNQSGDVDKFTNSGIIAEGYEKGTVLPITFVIDKVNSSITASCGAYTASLPYTVAAETLTGLKFGQYRNYGAVTVSDIMIQEPNNNYLAIIGDEDFAKVGGKTVTRQYALGQSVIVPDETFTWTVSGDNTAVTIADGVLSVADSAAAGTYTITATSTTNAEKTATLEVEIGDFQVIETSKIEVSGPQAYKLGEDTTGTYKIVNAIDSYGDDIVSLLADVKWSVDNAAVAEITDDGVLTVKGAGTATVTGAVTNGTAVTKVNVPITVGAYYVKAPATGDITAVDTSSLVSNSAITGYQVTTSKDGVLVKQTVETAAPTSVDTTGADTVEIAPVFEYKIGVPGELGTVGEGYDIPIPADTYNFVVTDNGERCDVYVNKQMLVNNILQGGSAVRSLAVNDVVVNEGVAVISTAEYPSGKGKNDVDIVIKVVKSPSNVERTKKMYVLGDSLVCIYYNGGSDVNNTYQTGWGQVLQNYVKGAEVVDLGNSGVTANGLYGTAFTQVLTSAKPGDYLVLESGYNDRTYDTEDIMKNALRNMYNEATALGVNVIFVSPNAAQHDYKGSVSWTTYMEDVAAELNVPYIDLSQKSYDFLYGTYGDNTDAVKATYNVSDGLHSQYRGAQKLASIVASGLIDLGYGADINTEYKYTFTDTLGNTIECQAAASAE
ncbi:MAG: hypothetical protein Q4G33_01750 [bacterium]|nr:hypothetical protein [bacterium]